MIICIVDINWVLKHNRNCFSKVFKLVLTKWWSCLCNLFVLFRLASTPFDLHFSYLHSCYLRALATKTCQRALTLNRCKVTWDWIEQGYQLCKESPVFVDLPHVLYNFSFHFVFMLFFCCFSYSFLLFCCYFVIIVIMLHCMFLRENFNKFCPFMLNDYFMSLVEHCQISSVDRTWNCS